jgi:hypothetical protein
MIYTCTEYEDLKKHLEFTQKQHAQSTARTNLRGIFLRRENVIRREQRANIAVFTQRISEHIAKCPICKSAQKTAMREGNGGCGSRST